jgi:hypothetical protein
MTFETKCFISLDDIVGIHIECKKCHLKLTIGLDEAVKQRMRLCPGCNKLWMEEDSPQQKAIVELAGALGDARRMAANSKCEFTVGLEIPCPESKARP